MFKKISDDAVAHKLAADLKKALLADRKALAALCEYVIITACQNTFTLLANLV
jgi:hypothetical protein